MSADWGVHRHPLHLPGLHGADWEPIDSDDPAGLPTVRAARALGYEPAPEAPLWCFLPAIWPDDARAWVQDLRIRHQTVSCDGRPSRRVPWSAADHAEVEADINDLLGDCGLPSRPAGRVWLLRSPGLTLDDVLGRLLGRLLAAAQDAGDDVLASSAFVEHVDAELTRLFRSTDP